MTAPSLSIVEPSYNEEACLAELHERLSRASKSVAGEDYEIVLINDGSRDGSWEMMRKLTASDPRLVAIDERVRVAINTQRVGAGLGAISRNAWISDAKTLLTKN